MEAIVLAGGLGTRLRSFVPDLPKPMAPINGRPFLEVLLTTLVRKGFTRVVLSIGYLANNIINHFGNHFAGIDIIYCIEDKPLGTGGAVRLALTQCDADHIYVFNGDTFLDLEVEAVEAQWQSRRHPIIVAREVPDTHRYGRLLIEYDRVVGFTEKGIEGKGVINAGCYIFDKRLLDRFPSDSIFSLEKDFLEKFVDDIFFEYFLSAGQFIDIGTPEDYQLAQSTLNININ